MRTPVVYAHVIRALRCAVVRACDCALEFHARSGHHPPLEGQGPIHQEMCAFGKYEQQTALMGTQRLLNAVWRVGLWSGALRMACLAALKHSLIAEECGKVKRCMHLVYYAHKKGVRWILEQPRSSTMLQYKPVLNMIQRTGAKVVHLDMGTNGALSVKPTV